MAYSIWYEQGWEYRLSAKPKQAKFDYNPYKTRPTYLLKMWRQFDDARYLKAYFAFEPYRISHEFKNTKLYQFVKRKMKS